MPEKATPDGTVPTLRHRTVRSFVTRSGRATVAQQRAMRELWPLYGIELSDPPFDVERAFARTAPLMMEIGFGAGEALLAFAVHHPELNCVGVEVHRPGVGHLLLGVREAGIDNLRVVCHDAVEVLERIASATIDTVHIFFPDPWPKKRHHKRRLIQPAFVSLLARALKSGGTLRLATDWEHYAMQMREVLDASNEFENYAGAAGFCSRPDVRPKTRFEQRGERLGHRVWDMEYHRRDVTSDR
jgi:tRNA (guanine-N7-)-methyltransferase